jgi:predicted RNase H-like HicB family nuclease
MARKFTAIYKKSGKWYLGWIEEIPGVNTQGKTLKETKENLKEAILLILETNKILNKDVSKGKIIIEPISVCI